MQPVGAHVTDRNHALDKILVLVVVVARAVNLAVVLIRVQETDLARATALVKDLELAVSMAHVGLTTHVLKMKNRTLSLRL